MLKKLVLKKLMLRKLVFNYNIIAWDRRRDGSYIRL